MKLQREIGPGGKFVVCMDNAFKMIKLLPLPYVGNKKKLLPHIYKAIIESGIEFETVGDVFSGSGSVSLMFKYMGKQVVSNDILTSSYCNTLAFVENSSVVLSEEEINYLIEHENPNRDSFVEDNYLATQFCTKGKSTKGNKFTLKECKFLDNYRANIDDLNHVYKQALAFAAINAVVARLPFGSIDQSADIMAHRVKQEQSYGKGSKNHDRRIGIYYDDEYNLYFDHWIRRYLRDFMGCLLNREDANEGVDRFVSNICKPFEAITKGAHNEDVNLFLMRARASLDCVYFDPPYGGASSDYLSLYRFQEEYIWKDDSLNTEMYYGRFIKPETYAHSFGVLLRAAARIPILIFSYNDSSWEGIDYIYDFLKLHRKNVSVTVLTGDYQYKYRTIQGNKKKGTEYLLIAR